MSESTAKVYKQKKKLWKNEAGKLHRVDGPAVESADGTKCWYQNDKIHRIDGPAIERPNGSKEWFQYGKLHRIDGPALENETNALWFYDNKLLGEGLHGFWSLWNLLNDEERQSVNLHMWLLKLTSR